MHFPSEPMSPETLRHNESVLNIAAEEGKTIKDLNVDKESGRLSFVDTGGHTFRKMEVDENAVLQTINQTFDQLEEGLEELPDYEGDMRHENFEEVKSRIFKVPAEVETSKTPTTVQHNLMVLVLAAEDGKTIKDLDIDSQGKLSFVDPNTRFYEEIIYKTTH